MNHVESISPAETARLVRAALHRAWPRVPFSVRTSVYAGGASIRVGYHGIAGIEPLESCYCHEGPLLTGLTPQRCQRCGYLGRTVYAYHAGMPTIEDVERVVGAYAGGGFDGSIDLQFRRTVFLAADGTVLGSQTPGTEGSRGTVPASDDSDTYTVATRAVRAVRPGADFIHVSADRR